MPIEAGAIRNVNPWVSQQDLSRFFDAIGVADAGLPTVDVQGFSLPGRPAIESFFREYVLEPGADRERYAALGVHLPNGILLYGPPGSGKTHTVDTLAGALKWPVFRLDLGVIGSPFIHQTAVSIRNSFDQAYG